LAIRVAEALTGKICIVKQKMKETG